MTSMQSKALLTESGQLQFDRLQLGFASFEHGLISWMLIGRQALSYLILYVNSYTKLSANYMLN